MSSFSDEDETPSSSEIEIVQEIRENIKLSILERCGKIRVLDMTVPINLNDIYTSVNILEKITKTRRIGNQLLQKVNFEDIERFGLSRIIEKRISALEAVEKYSKLMILGKAGAGKSIFLKYLAIQCIKGEFQPHLVPIFLNLKDFAVHTTLIEYITQFIQPNIDINQLLISGKMLILLDGLDEVKQDNNNHILQKIRDFSHQFSNNHFVVTSRIAAGEYTFEQFTEVEIADFDDQQITDFVFNWFQDQSKAKLFIQKLP